MKNFKKYFILFMLLLLTLALVACGETDSKDDEKKEDKQEEKKDEKEEEKKEPEHVHEFTLKENKVEFKVSDATCTTGSVYYYSCSCGEKGTETYEANDALGHKLNKGVPFTTYSGGEGIVKVSFHCDQCDNDVTVDVSIANHEHMCQIATTVSEEHHQGECVICGETFEEECSYNNYNECYYCGSDKTPTREDSIWQLAQEAEVVPQNDVKAYYYGKGEEKYNYITVTKKSISYNTGIGCSFEKEEVKFQYESDTDNYYYREQEKEAVEIGTYGWFPVSFKVNKCVDAIGQTYYYMFENGNVGVYFTCNGECKVDSYHEFNAKGQLLIYKSLTLVDEENEELVVYTYSYGKEW